jgi:hypothetical protein
MKIKKVVASVVIVAGLGAGALVAAAAADPADVGLHPNHFDTNTGGGFDYQVYSTDDSPRIIGLDPGIYNPPAQGLNYGNGGTATLSGGAATGDYVQPGRTDGVVATAGYERAATQ